MAGSPDLKKLKPRLNKSESPCFPEAKTAIEAAIAKIEEVDLDGMTLVTQEAPEPA